MKSLLYLICNFISYYFNNLIEVLNKLTYVGIKKSTFSLLAFPFEQFKFTDDFIVPFGPPFLFFILVFLIIYYNLSNPNWYSNFLNYLNILYPTRLKLDTTIIDTTTKSLTPYYSKRKLTLIQINILKLYRLLGCIYTCAFIIFLFFLGIKYIPAESQIDTTKPYVVCRTVLNEEGISVVSGDKCFIDPLVDLPTIFVDFFIIAMVLNLFLCSIFNFSNEEEIEYEYRTVFAQLLRKL